MAKAKVVKTVKEICTPIIVEGIKAGAEKNVVINGCYQAIMAADPKAVPDFGQLMKFYAVVPVEAGLHVDPAKATELLMVEVEKSNWEGIPNYASFEGIVAEIAETVPGVKDTRIKAVITTYCKEQGIELPKKDGVVSLKAVGGKAVAGMVDLFVQNPKATKHDCLLVAGPTVKVTSKDPVKTARGKVDKVYTALYAVANKITLAQALTETKADTFQAPAEETAE